MARNEEKHYGRLNRLYLLREKEEYEKANPERPRLDTLYTPEEIQKWLPSIKKDIDFYLKKSQVTCYSDMHIEECREKVIKLEKEFKAFVRKLKQLSTSPLEAIPWTNRSYKRKKLDSPEESLKDVFKHIPTPILENETPDANKIISECANVNFNLMNQPLSFASLPNKDEQTEKQQQKDSNLYEENLSNCDDLSSSEIKTRQIEESDKHETSKKFLSIVNYDSSDSEDS